MTIVVVSLARTLAFEFVQDATGVFRHLHVAIKKQ